MKKKSVSGIMLTLLLIGMLTLAFRVQPVKASGTIYIRANGSVDPPTANITSVDNVTYTFTGNIINDSIVVERNNIVVDGAGYTLQGTGSGTGIDLTGRSNVTIKNMEIKAFYYGIYLWSSNNIISGNNITNNEDVGVLLFCSSNNIVSGNNITNNEYCIGLRLLGSSNNVISGNNIRKNGEGIRLDGSSYNSISGNNITENSWFGIRLGLYGSSNYNTISGNTITNNWCGIEHRSSSNNAISGNNISANNGDGIELVWSSNYNTISGNNITKNDFCGIWLYGSSEYNSINGNNITANNGDGIGLYESSSNTISGNNIRNNSYGIRLEWSSEYNSINGNNITANNGDGILLSRSSNYNTVSGNKITENNEHGILLESYANTLRNNNASNNRYNFGVSGWPHIQDIDDSNTVDGKPVYYWVNRRDMTVPLDAGYVALINCTRITIKNLTLTNNGQGPLLVNTQNSYITNNNITNNCYGIGLYESSSNTISGNSITANNGPGIYLEGPSDYNSISGNNIANNEYGIYLVYAFYNTIYHNSFISNTKQVYDYFWEEYPPFSSINTWDDGHPSGGNYWSDHNPPDLYSGPYQNETDSDGIGDTPYVIDENNVDKYPLMRPYYVRSPDVNGDGTVNIIDIAICCKAFGSYPGDLRWNPIADINQDNLIDIFDLVLIGVNFGKKG